MTARETHVCLPEIEMGCQVKITTTHHTIDLASDMVCNDKALCFFLDAKGAENENIEEPPNKKRRKKNEKKTSPVTYGAKLNLEKLVGCEALKIGWRVRQGKGFSLLDCPVHSSPGLRRPVRDRPRLSHCAP